MIENILRGLTKVFGSRTDREIKKLWPRVEAIGALSDEFKALSDAELRERSEKLKTAVRGGTSLDSVLHEAFALVRETSSRTPPPGAERGLRHYDVQMIGGMVLHSGKIAEMATGEGKTLVATLPAYLNGLTGKGVHVITVNDYLASRDSLWMGPIYERLGLTVGVIQSEANNTQRREAYASDITYGTNNEFGFDYLRDNMKSSLEEQAQRRSYAILDEVDNILIDEARTPLIISGPSEGDVEKYSRAYVVASKLQKDKHFEIKEKENQAILNEEGIARAEELAGVDSFYSGNNLEWPHLIEQSLRANHLFKKDVDYVVGKDDDGRPEIVIVDEFTGRLMPGRRWSDGLHQSVEAKERIPIQRENQTLATITFQNFFKLYDKLAGMTGTALTEAGGVLSIYGLDVMPIPTNKPIARQDHEDLIYDSEKNKFTAVIDDIIERHGEGRPTLVGTTSIEKSEKLSKVLDKRGIAHDVLNAKQHEREADIIAHAGESQRVTIATNMAGRGTDIKLSEDVKAKGGLHIIGTERHEARRIDNQLRGRAGRQGDPGSSRFYLSLDDDLMRRFAGEKMRGMMKKLGLEGSEAIEHKWVSGSVAKAQKKVEDRNFEIRKRLLEYDEVMSEQRKLVYDYRQQILRGEAIRDLVFKMIDGPADRIVDTFCPEDQTPEEWDRDSIKDWFQRRTTDNLLEDTAIAGNDAGAIQDAVQKRLHDLYDQRAEGFGPELSESIARFVLLNAFDSKWKTHLYNMDALKSGIGLRAYANEDPKIAYKREGYALFEGMLKSIEDEVADRILRVEIQGREEAAELEEDMDYWGGAVARHEEFMADRQDMEKAAYENQTKEAPKPFVREEPKLGRNDPCHCGSGIKFKKCHGRNG